VEISLRVDDLDCLLRDTFSPRLCVPAFGQNTVTESSKQLHWKPPNPSACYVRISNDAMGLPSCQTARKSRQYGGCGRKVIQMAPKLAKHMAHQSDCPIGHKTDPFWVEAPEKPSNQFPSTKTWKSTVQAQGYHIVRPAISSVCKNGKTDESTLSSPLFGWYDTCKQTLHKYPLIQLYIRHIPRNENR